MKHRVLPLGSQSQRPLVMGVVNVTPDSFYDGGCWASPVQAVEHAASLAEEGADILDIGGESTRPGAVPITVAEELERVMPVIEALVGHVGVPISIDTSRPEVMTAAVAAGAAMINDTRALESAGALETAASLGVPVCLMHMQGSPGDMQNSPRYRDVVFEVARYLKLRADACLEAGMAARDRIVLDPGFGFGKTLQHNQALFQAIPRLAALGYPLLVGVSRKTMLGTITGRNVEERMPASVVAAVLAAQLGARILRVHDVAATVDGLAVAAALTPLSARWE